MIATSADYKSSMVQPSTKRVIRGTIDNVEFTGDDILTGSLKYSGKIVQNADIKLGGVFIETLSCSFLQSLTGQITRGTWKGRIISLEVGLLIDEEEEEYEYVPLGVFEIDDAMHSKTGVDIKAYSYMSKFDSASGLASNLTGTFYEILSLACTNCGVTLGMTEEEIEDLPNGDATFSLYSPNDCETWRDVISWVACTMCGFATINRDGELVIKTWSDTSEMNVSQDVRFNDGLYSDFETFYTGISVVNMRTEKTEYMGMPIDNGLTMNLGSNPFMQYGTESFRTQVKQNILTALQKFRYVPFSVSSYLDPSFELGDVFTMTGGRANGSKVCVMAIDYSFQKGLKLQGFGNDPALANARSKVDKDISGLISQTDSKSIQYYSFVNPRAFENIESEKQVASFRFATQEDTTVTLWHEFKLDCELDDEDIPMVVTVHYYLNGVEENYTPVMTIGENGLHTLSYNYFLAGISGGQVNDWKVTIECEDGSADINAGDIHILLAGQGLVSNESFLGYIDASDDIEALTIAGLNASAFTETVSASLITNTDKTASDSINAYDIDSLDTSLAEGTVAVIFVYNEDMISFCGEGLYCGDDMDTCGMNLLSNEGGT